jgi:hypothetical protein
MTPLLMLACLSLPGQAPAGPVAVGELAPPAYSLQHTPPGPRVAYQPQPGDVVLSTTSNFKATLKYIFAGSWKPTHAGVVVQTASGQLAVLEAGGGRSHEVKLVPIAERPLRESDAKIWIRQVHSPLTPEQSARLTEFAQTVNGRKYDTLRQMLLATPFRTRGPIRTFFLGKPEGIVEKYFCSQIVVEALVYAGAVDPTTARPSATFPRDMFFDHSLNPYLNRHPLLRGNWAPPALWIVSHGPTISGGRPVCGFAP